MDLEMVSFIADHSEHKAVRTWWERLNSNVQHLRQVVDISEVRVLALKVFGSEPTLLCAWMDFVEEHPEI